jgi:uncharacterized membrane protein YbhN (UPF0104 family)
MTEATSTAVAAPARLLPFHNASRLWRLVKVLIWLAGFALLLVVLELAGIDVQGWLRAFWDAIDAIPARYVVAALTLQTAHVLLMGVIWFQILRAGFPDAPLAYRQVLAAYAVGLALNGFLPANIGTIAMLLMLVAMISGATFAGVLGAAVVQKLFFALVAILVYLYLFTSVAGSFSRHLGGVHDHPWLSTGLVAILAALVVVLARVFKDRALRLWHQAQQGGAILARPRAYLVRVALPSLAAWLLKLGVTATFLAGYGIPITLHSVLVVTGGNSAAGAVSLTPGGAGISQAANVAALDSITSASNAAAYSIGQQLVVLSWNVILATALVLWAFGWSGGRRLVEDSYSGARARMRRRDGGAAPSDS